ncbi:glycosyltransferase [Pedococcus sp. NPDC057267]|uniref:glycosyltransferase n=1 Tax=Pedococcus sp. NPDC057267 TaxID=3346077 RepID=UPI0036403001
MSILVASVPSGHVYVRHLAPPPPSPAVVVRLPDPPSGASPDSPWWPPRMLTSAWVHGHASEFDLMHVHFGFDAVSPEDLGALAVALRQHDKPLVLTVHDLRNPHHPTAEAHDAQLDVLVAAADAVLTLTPGAAAVIEQRWGRTATVVPHPHVVPSEWLARPRPTRDRFVVGLHAKSLRANMEPLALVHGIVDALADLPGAVLRVDAHTDVMTEGFARHDSALAGHLTALADEGLVDLRVHDYFTDDELWAYLQGLDVSVLPYRFGTHSGWLEACHDLGTWVAAPDCGFYAQQRPCLTYAADGAERVPSLVAALREAHRGWQEGRPAPRATAMGRRAERERVAAVHHEVYEGVLGRRRACTS